MASVPIKPSSAQTNETVEARFRRLAEEWEGATAHLSSMAAASQHPAHQQIINLGPDVIPYLLRDMEDHETHWFAALRAITGIDPIPPSAAGNIPQMIQAWLHWAKAQGYRW